MVKFLDDDIEALLSRRGVVDQIHVFQPSLHLNHLPLSVACQRP
jgi:hypothetical protein